MKNWKDLFVKNKKELIITLASGAGAFLLVVAGLLIWSQGVLGVHTCKFEDVVDIVDATCEVKGLTTYKCSVEGCEKIKKVESKDYAEHNWEEATCERPKTCKDCFTTEGSSLGNGVHSYPYKPACYQRAVKCNNCNTYLQPKSHVYGNWVVKTEATCNKKGTEVLACTTKGCDSWKEMRETEMISHVFTLNEENTDECTGCGLKASEDLQFARLANGSYQLISVGENRDRQTIIIPSVYNGWPVKSIARNAIDDNADLKNLVIIASELYIDAGAFANCVNLETVEIITKNNGKVVLEDDAFAGCKKLKTVTLGDQITQIGNGAFEGCVALETVNINKETSVLTKVGENAFKDCAALKEIVLPDSVEAIYAGAFKGCTSLKKAYIGEKLDRISEGMFEDCSSLEGINVEDLSATEWYGNIPDNVFSIDASAFKGTNIKVIKFGEESHLNWIGAYAFKDSALNTLNIPNGLKSVGANAFENAGTKAENIGLNQIHVKDIAKWCEIEFENGKANPLSAKGKLVLTDKDLPNYNMALTEVVIPDGVTEIKTYAFYGYTSLKKVTIGKDVGSIGAYAFGECSGLKNINYLPIFCNDVRENIFYKAGNGATVTIGAEVLNVPSRLFYTKDDTGREENYRPNIKTVTFEENSVCTDIGAYAFANCISLENVKVGENVVRIAEYAFSDEIATKDYQLTTLVLSDSVSNLSVTAFANCKKLTNITAPGKVVKYLPKAALKNVTITSGDVEANEFADNATLETVVLGENVTYIRHRAFYNCELLKSVDAKGVKYIEESAFAYCSSLKTVTFSVVNAIDGRVFMQCASLEKIVLPKTLNFIGQNAFKDCSKLKEVDFEHRSDWTVTGWDENNEWRYNYKGLSGTDLSQLEVAARFLTKTYTNTDWNRNK